jgi:hypothetical protein
MGSSGEDAIHTGASKHRVHCDLWIKIGSQKVPLTQSHVSRVAGGLSSDESTGVRVVASTLGYEHMLTVLCSQVGLAAACVMQVHQVDPNDFDLQFQPRVTVPCPVPCPRNVYVITCQRLLWGK